MTRSSPRTLVLALAALGLAACSGLISTPGDDDDSGGDGSDPGAPEPSALRRLSNVEYNNSVRDLYPGVEIPVQSFPADNDVHGFENNATVQSESAVLIERYQVAAAEITEWAMDRPDLALPCVPGSPADESACGRQLVQSFGARAFRRPLTSDEVDRFVAFFETARTRDNFFVAAHLVMQAIIQSPHFIYHVEMGINPEAPSGSVVELTQYEIAARLAYFLWNSLPDEELTAAAAAGELATTAQIETQARRMLANPRARAMVVDFHRQWLGLDEIEQKFKDEQLFPEFTPTLRAAMRQETERFVEYVAFDGPGTLRALFVNDKTFVDDELAALYGVPAPGQWSLVDVDRTQRAGLLTQPSFLAIRAHSRNPSPVHRGVFVLERVLCQDVPAPPPNVDTSPPEGTADDPRTNRERYTRHQVPGCDLCHSRIDGVGFGLESYDAIGRYRTTDNGFPVDDASELVETDVDGPFEGGVELSERLAGSAQVQRCYVTNWWRFAFGRSDAPADAPTLDTLDAAFAASGQNIVELLVSIATHPTFRERIVP